MARERHTWMRGVSQWLANYALNSLDWVLFKVIVNRWPYRTIFRDRYVSTVAALCEGGKSVLDVGCGKGSRIALASGKLYGVDIHEPSLRVAMASGLYTSVVVGDVTSIGCLFRPKSLDILMALDVIEHMDKEDGIRFLRQMESIARKRVVAFTPNGFVPQPEEAVAVNPWQAHRSGWTVDEFQSLGYQVMGWNGWKEVRGPSAAIRLRPHALFQILADVSQIVLRYVPQCAFHLLCWKDVSE